MTYYPPGITRQNGYVKAGSFYGYQTRFFTVAAAGFYTDAATGYTNYVPNSPFELAVRACENVASVTIVGTPTSAGFTIAIDGDNFAGRGDNTGYAADTATLTGSTSTLAANIFNATGVVAQVTEVVLSGVSLTAGTVLDWDNV